MRPPRNNPREDPYSRTCLRESAGRDQHPTRDTYRRRSTGGPPVVVAGSYGFGSIVSYKASTKAKGTAWNAAR